VIGKDRQKKLDTMQTNRETRMKDKMLKKDVGIRFKLFRADQKKPQHELAAELKVHQSTITNIEHGTTFPKISYLYYFFERYNLNVNWLITGQGDMYLIIEKEEDKGAEPVLMPHVHYGDPTWEQYMELSRLMQIPVIEQVMMAKLSESKFIFKDEVNAYIQKYKDEQEAVKKTEDVSRVEETMVVEKTDEVPQVAEKKSTRRKKK